MANRSVRTILAFAGLLFFAHLIAPAAPQPDLVKQATKPKVAIFPLSGNADPSMRERVAFAFRAKLARDGTYDPIPEPVMADLEPEVAIDLRTPVEHVRNLAGDLDAAILIWGEVNAIPVGPSIRLKVLDLREAKPAARDVARDVVGPAGVRDAAEEILATLPGVGPFGRPNESAVMDDAASKALWATNPNLVANAHFSGRGGWEGVLAAEKDSLEVADGLPPMDRIHLSRTPNRESGSFDYALAMRLSVSAAESTGLAARSSPIAIERGRRYRVSLRYRSDGPTPLVFVKGYADVRDANGALAEREVFRTQSPTGSAADKTWRSIVFDVNPSHPTFEVRRLRVDLYAHLKPGAVVWDDVVLKDIGESKQSATPTTGPTTRPATRPVR